MAKKFSGSSARAMRIKRNAKVISDHEIDYSDIPPLSKEQLAAMKRLGRPLLGSAPRKLIAVRIDPIVLERLRRQAKKKRTGYQTLINDILAQYVKTAA